MAAFDKYMRSDVVAVDPGVVNAVDAVFAQPQQSVTASRRVSHVLRNHRVPQNGIVLSADQLDNVFGETV